MSQATSSFVSRHILSSRTGLALLCGHAALALACAEVDEPDPATDPARRGHAETLYSDFSRFADDSVSFAVRTTAEGRVAELTDVAPELVKLAGAPDYVVGSSVAAVRLHSLRYVEFTPDWVADQVNDLLRERAAEGLAAEDARYRVLAVTTSLNGDVREHGALEVCWDAAERCTVIDPAMAFIEHQVAGVRERRAQGWAPIVTLSGEVGNPPSAGGAPVAAAAQICHVSGEPTSVKSKTYTEAGFDQAAGSGWKIRVGSLSSTITCSVVNGACKPVATRSVGTSSALSAPSSSYYACNKIGASKIYSHSPNYLLTLMNTGCAFKYSGSSTPSLSYSVSWGTYGWQAKINTTYYPYLVDNLNGLRHGVTCKFSS